MSDSPSVRTLTLHSALAMVSATSAVILLHEFGHLVAGVLQGETMRLFPFGVFGDPDAPRAVQALEQIAGPAFSLVTGLLVIALTRPRESVGATRLFLTWFGFLSVMEGAGYLLLTPFGVGDTGASALAYGLEDIVVWPAFVVSLGALFLLARAFGRRIATFVPHGDLARLRGLSFFPWLIGMPATVLLTLIWLVGADVDLDAGSLVAVLMGTVALAVWAPMAMPFTASVPVERCDTHPIRTGEFPVLAAGVLVICLVVNLLLLGGPTFG